MNLEFALVCDHALESPDGSLDLHGIRSNMAAPGFPAMRDRMVFVMALTWARNDRGRFHFKVELVDPDGKPVLTIPGHTEVAPSEEGRPPPRTQMVQPLDEVVFPQPGLYRFEIQAGGRSFEGPTLFLIEVDAESTDAAT